MSESEIIRILRHAAAVSSASADIENYQCCISIREARLAADAIERLAAGATAKEAECERLREALQNIARVPCSSVNWDSGQKKTDCNQRGLGHIACGGCQARAALAPEGVKHAP